VAHIVPLTKLFGAVEVRIQFVVRGNKLSENGTRLRTVWHVLCAYLVRCWCFFSGWLWWAFGNAGQWMHMVCGGNHILWTQLWPFKLSWSVHTCLFLQFLD